MEDLGTAFSIARRGSWPAHEMAEVAGVCLLDYDARLLRRRRLATRSGDRFLVNLDQTLSVEDGDAFLLEGGGYIAIEAAPENLLRVRGPDLVRLAWHIGNRHTPCQIGPEYLLIQAEAIIAHMLEHFGARTEPVTAPFTPEGGAYGHGRTQAHAHGATAHAH